MKLVVDTNIVFSAVLNTEGKIGDLIMNSQGSFEFHTCDALRIELGKHKSKLQELSQMTNEQLEQSIFQITDNLVFHSESLVPFHHWKKAADLVREVDMDDIAFVALSEFLEAKLWTGDKTLMKGLASKGYSKFITTEELMRLRSFL